MPVFNVEYYDPDDENYNILTTVYGRTQEDAADEFRAEYGVYPDVIWED